MNPFLEQSDAWEDFHSNFLTHAQEALSAQVGPNYVVKIEVRLLLHELSARERGFIGKADVGVATTTKKEAANVTAATPAPIHLRLPAVEVEKHRSLEIRDRRNRRIVTAIELLSPSNKNPGPDRDDYLAKRRHLLASQTHFVEIDLRRGGSRPNLPELPRCDYYALVSRYEDRPGVGFWPIGLRDRLPVIPIPLSAPDADVLLDLKAVLDRAYDAPDYGKYIYQDTPEPPLSTDDMTWARQFIPAADRDKA
jgi:Protein of unknown function (DUF4058)